MERIKIPKRSKRTDLIKNRARSFYEWFMLRELEQMVSDRLTEKLIISAVALMWLLVGLYGKTIYCALWGIPLAIISLFIGVWML